MGTYFLDTSALVKRHVLESGSQWVRSLGRTKAGNTLVISEAALTEVVASLCRMTSEQLPRLNAAERDRVIVNFQRLVRLTYIVVQMNRAIYLRAAELCRSHPLRSYDAIQLACALTKRDDDRKARLPDLTFVCADIVLLAVVAAEGLNVENPNTHP